MLAREETQYHIRHLLDGIVDRLHGFLSHLLHLIQLLRFLLQPLLLLLAVAAEGVQLFVHISNLLLESFFLFLQGFQSRDLRVQDLLQGDYPVL